MPIRFKPTGFSIKARRRLVPISQHKPDKKTQHALQRTTTTEIANILPTLNRMNTLDKQTQKHLQESMCTQVTNVMLLHKLKEKEAKFQNKELSSKEHDNDQDKKSISGHELDLEAKIKQEQDKETMTSTDKTINL